MTFLLLFFVLWGKTERLFIKNSHVKQCLFFLVLLYYAYKMLCFFTTTTTKKVFLQ